MFDLPTLDGVAKVVIDEHIIEDEAQAAARLSQSQAEIRAPEPRSGYLAGVRIASRRYAAPAPCNRPLGPRHRL